MNDLIAPHPLRDYALLADGQRGILVGPCGDFAWMCFPRWHDDGVFCSLIGGRSTYAVTPVGRYVWGGYYEPGSLIWHSRWTTESGVVESREALELPSEADHAIVLRRIRVLEGTAKLRVVLDAGAGFDNNGMSRLRQDEDGAWRAELGAERMAWGGAAEAKPVDGEGRRRSLEFDLELAAGERRDLVLALGHDGEAVLPPDVDRCWAGTEDAWKKGVPDFGDTLAPRDAAHAYAVMRGMTAPGGGMVAAATTSLPERAEEGRNYDYRYVWIRDQAYAGQAVAAHGPHGLLDDAVGFLAARLNEDGAETMPAYTVLGDPVPGERRLQLPGYPGGSDIAGNWVRKQFQLDAFGEALLLFAAAARHDHLDADGWTAAEAAAKAIEERWREPDAGIWELEPDRWSHSRLICAAGLRAIGAVAPGAEKPARRLALADVLVADVAANALADDGHWCRSPGDRRVDAALLLAGVRGAVPAEDPRTPATLAAVERELTEDGYCYRYRAGHVPLGEDEGAFLLCGFWMALAYQQQGDRDAAGRWFERSRAACGSPALYSEEFDVAQRQLRGNLPQAFVHALLLECSARLEA